MPGDPASPPDAVVVSVGLGARFLGGVEDKDVYPIRGQTVLIKAPWVKLGMALYKENDLDFVYIIPRSSGEVIVGGTRTEDDWYPSPRPETSQMILERGLALCPELAPPEIRSTRKPIVDDVLPQVTAYGCGLRPARKGGIRLQTEWTEGVGGRGKVPVIHNYGHGGGGYQTSWSSASVVLELLRDALETDAVPVIV
ncbi:hypothetical protein BDQ17DRAFT_1356052 [Cyathus striatus]|nr:hypothetical protein BDQ17DRAFT_1356052 [Cyathus striatus]